MVVSPPASLAPAPTVAGGAVARVGPGVGTGLATRPARSLSPSRAGDFATCALLYRFRVIDRLPEPPSLAAARGTLVHSVLEHLFDLPAGQRTLARAVELVPLRWSALVAQRPELAELEGVPGSGTSALLARYFQLEDPRALEPVARERAVSVELPSGLVLRGVVDRLDRTAHGALRVVDYKTGRAPTPEREFPAIFQIRFYALALWLEQGEVPAALDLVYLGDGVQLRHSPDAADLRATRRRVEALWAAIERAQLTGDWRPNPSRTCDWCAHRALCPAWGGQPPAHPDIEVRDVPIEALATIDLTEGGPRAGGCQG